jgi:HK97 family phage major capsid protein
MRTHIPIQRYAGSMAAFGVYGLPTFAGRRVSGRTLAILGIVGLLFTLYAFGVIDLAAMSGGGLVIGAGTTSAELGTKLARERQAHGTWLAGYKKDGGYDMPADKVTEFHTRNDALAELQKQYEVALQVERSAAENEAKLLPQGTIAANKGGAAEFKDGERIETKAQVDAAFKGAFGLHASTLAAIAKGGRGTVSFELNTNLKTLLQVTVHAPQADRQGTFASALYFGDVEDTFPHGSTTSKSVDYFIQTTDTDNAAAVAEGSAPTDSAFAWTLTTDPVETVSDWIPMTHEAIADNVGFQSTVEGMLARRLQKKSNNLILAGDGNTPNPTGVFIRTGFQTQAKGSDPAFDAIHKAITKVEVTGDAICNFIYAHPTDWQNMRLTRTVDGIYILGNPADSAPLNLWGIPVKKTTGIGSAGTAGVGDTSYAEVTEREGLTVEISTEHSTFFTERKVAVLLYRRFAVADHRPSAFATVTGL